MFDQLIESEPVGAEFKSRRNYFLTSTAVVGILFISAVVISIYASDYGIGSARLDLSEMLAPVDMAAAEPEPAKPKAPSNPAISWASLLPKCLAATTTSLYPTVQ
mgnify:CR=1 FL=1